jgi:hypothetical protein
VGDSTGGELVIRPRPLLRRADRIVSLVALAFVFPFLVVMHVSVVLLGLLAVLALSAILYRAWLETRFAYVVGPYHFGYIGANGARRTWPASDLVKIDSTTRPTAFGRENFYLLVGKDGQALMSVRPSLITAEDLEKFWTRLGSRPSS